jgi:small subunit ribosomal protein S13
VVGLTYIYGIGPTTSAEILRKLSISESTRIRDLSEADVAKLRETIDREYQVEGDLRREVSMNIKRLQEINAYRGMRHRLNLPSRGQRTRTNARTKRGARKTVPGKKRARK